MTSSTTARSGSYNKLRTKRLFKRFKEKGDLQARKEIIESHVNLVRFLANKFKNRGENLEDLIQVGYLGLIKAVDRFDINLGHEFTTYATPTILGEIKRHFRDKGWSVRVPRRLQELSAKVNKATEALTYQLQRTPTVQEIAEHLGVSVDEVLEAMESSSAYSSISLEASADDDDNQGLSQIEKYQIVDKDLALADDRIVLDEVLQDLNDKEKEIIDLRFIQGLTQVEIAETLGISQVQVSRLLRKTLHKLEDKIDPEKVLHHTVT